MVAGYCLITAAVAFVLHLALESTVWPETATQWMAIVILGAIPLGAGFYAWDYGCKHGDIMILGALSYAAPLFSVLVLLLAGFGVFHWSVALACILITVGAAIAAKDMLFKRELPVGTLDPPWGAHSQPEGRSDEDLQSTRN